MPLPIVGANVVFRDGPLKGQRGFIEAVKDWRAATRSLNSLEIMGFTTRALHDLGPNWQTVWFEAKVRSASGKVLPNTYGPRDLQIDPDGYRSDPNHSQR